MSDKIGVRELKNRTSRIIRTVREEGLEYIITAHGQPVALLRPFTEQDRQRLRQTEMSQSLAEMKALAQEVAEAWTSPKSGVELINEQRR